MNNIYFFEERIKSGLKNKICLKTFLASLIYAEKKTLESLSIIFCTDKYLLEINKKYLNHHYYTDTITFLLSSKNQPIEGEVYISCDRIKENSKIFKVSYQLELIRVIFHSTLHLCGYSDKPEKQKKEMDSIQENYLNRWIVSRETTTK